MSDLDLSRRAALGLMAGTVVVAAAPPVAATLAATPAALPEAAAAVVAEDATPWMWWSTRHGFEHFDGPYGSRDEAVAAAEELYGDHAAIEVVEAHQQAHPSVAMLFEGRTLLEHFNDLAFESGYSGELNPEDDPWSSVPEADFDDLAERLNAAARAWFVERDISRKMSIWCFQGQRNKEVIAGTALRNDP